MRNELPPPREPSGDSQEGIGEATLSLSRLRAAFATMLGGPSAKASPAANNPRTSTKESARSGEPASGTHATSGCVSPPVEISPRSVAEAMLFVGRPDGGPLSARELAAAMRGVSPSEIESAIEQLNAQYQADEAPYHIERTSGGYRLALRPEFDRVRDKFHGRIKEARLSPAVLEVLAVLAYNQPATAEQLSEIRGAPCGAGLATLVRRKLARLDRPNNTGQPHYSTTERFLQLFGLESLSALPRSEDLEKL